MGHPWQRHAVLFLLAGTLGVSCNNSPLSQTKGASSSEDKRTVLSDPGVIDSEEAAFATEAAATDGELALYGRSKTVKIRITNLTKGQVLTPPVVVAHNRNFQLFEIGGTVSDAFAEMAENGANGSYLSVTVKCSNFCKTCVCTSVTRR